MDFNKLMQAIGVVLIGLIGSFTLMTYWNYNYGSDLGNSFNETSQHMLSISDSVLINTSLESANSTYTTSGGSQGDASVSLSARALNFFTIIPSLFGIFPSLLQDAAGVFGIPPEYTGIATALFLFSFALTFAVYLLLGAKR